MSEPLVTVLMSVYNGAEFLAPALDSVLAQTDPRWRMLIVDDASGDTSREIVSSYDDSRIELVALERNGGQTAALNLGLQRITTPWVARLDQDDVCRPQRLERQLAYVEEHPQTAAVGSLVDFIDPAGDRAGSYRPGSTPREVVEELFVRGCPIVHSAVLYRRDAALAVGGYATGYDYAQDLAMWISLSGHGEIANVPEVLTCVRVHPGQTSRAPTAAVRQLSEMLEITATIPPHVELSPSGIRLWRARRTRLLGERAIMAARANDHGLAGRSAAAALGGVIRDPFALPRIAGLAAASIERRIRARLRPGHAHPITGPAPPGI